MSLKLSLNQPCFCGANKKFSSCCQPFIEQKVNNDTNQKAFPQTPEQLMRSRFSAYVVGNGQYIYDTYAKSSQALQSVKEINDWSNACTWLALQIHPVNNSDIAATQSSEQFVEFSAFYITDDILCELRENSRFILQSTELADNTKNARQGQQWRYVDGNIINNAELTIIKRKALCPCNYYPTSWTIKKGKKFKQCCGKN